MCGITAVWGEPDASLSEAMMSRLTHRGPDGSGLFSQGKTTLGHRRLSIIDPEGGKQPILNSDKSCAIVVNGEIYNYKTLKESLSQQYPFSTNSDSEVPLHLFTELQQAMPEQLDGMFSLIVSDGENLFAARDTVGIKPLYYGKSGDRLVFASELKALAGYATEVKEFPPGTLYHTQTGFRKYREIPKAEPEERSIEEWCSIIRERMTYSVKKRLMSDVPLGVFLSGGLDSSIIAALARQEMPEMHTFSVGVAGSRDLQAARIMAQHLDSIHHEYAFTREEIKQALPEIIYSLESFDQDLVRSAVPCHFVSRLAAQYVKVILTGEGADELFAGYAYHKDYDTSMPLHEELYRSVLTLHNINLQRVDRLTMAHSIEGRVPFLDLSMIDLGQRIPADLKIHQQENDVKIEKWILRKAFADLLPESIAWRTKEQFDEGSGSSDMLAELAAEFMSATEAAEYIQQHPQDHLRSHEEAVYHKLLCDVYQASDPATILANIGRWQHDRLVA